jgi:hypothetical protein
MTELASHLGSYWSIIYLSETQELLSFQIPTILSPDLGYLLPWTSLRPGTLFAHPCCTITLSRMLTFRIIQSSSLTRNMINSVVISYGVVTGTHRSIHGSRHHESTTSADMPI